MPPEKGPYFEYSYVDVELPDGSDRVVGIYLGDGEDHRHWAVLPDEGNEEELSRSLGVIHEIIRSTEDGDEDLQGMLGAWVYEGLGVSFDVLEITDTTVTMTVAQLAWSGKSYDWLMVPPDFEVTFVIPIDKLGKFTADIGYGIESEEWLAEHYDERIPRFRQYRK